MRKLLVLFVILGPLCPAFAASGAKNLVIESGLAFSTQKQINLEAYGTPQSSAKNLSMQVTYTSTTFSNSTFEDGRQSTGSITVASNDISSAAAVNTLTVPATAMLLGTPATAQITVLSTESLTTAVISLNNGSQTLIFRQGFEWLTGATSTHTAQNIATAINGQAGLAASRGDGASAVVYSTATSVGGFGNDFTLTLSANTSLSTTTWSGGVDRALLNTIIAFNGDGVRNGYQWSDESNTSTGTAASIATWLNNYGVIRATATGSVVFATATVGNLVGNTFTLASSSLDLVIASPFFTGGQSGGSVSVNGVTFTEGVDFFVGNVSSNTAANLATAIENSSATTGVHAQAAASLITSTSIIVGTSANYAMTTSTPSALTLAGALMTGGSNSAFSINSSLISLPSHGFTTALQILYSGTPVIDGLTTGTTYFAVVVNVDNIRLSSTSVVAQSGNGIVITSSHTGTTFNTYTLAPLVWEQGLASAIFQVSNDGVNWADYLTTALGISVSSQTFVAAIPATTEIQDFGPINYKWLRYNIIGPTSGGVDLNVILNAKE